jgi:hypothetical protein
MHVKIVLKILGFFGIVTNHKNCVVSYEKNFIYIGWFTPYYENDLIDQINKLKNSSKPICIPVDYSIWNKHKICTWKDPNLYENFFDTLTSESDFDWHLLSNFDYVKEIKYCTYLREYESVKIISEQTQHIHDLLLKDYTLDVFEPSLLHLRCLFQIYQLSDKLFLSHSGFSSISFFKFLFINVFFKVKQDKISNKLMVLKNKSGQFVGFCSYYVDIQNKYLYIKTIGIDESFQKLGLSNLFVHRLHNSAVTENLGKVFYLFVKEGNSVDKMSKSDVKLVSIHSLFVIR